MKLALLILTLLPLSTYAQDCPGVKKEYDKFKSKTRYTTPIGLQIGFIKVVSEEDTLYLMRLETNGLTLTVKKGVIILFENGTKLEKPDVKVDPRAASSGYDYTAYIELTEDDRKILSENIITDYRLFIYDQKVKPKAAEKYRSYIKCLSGL